MVSPILATNALLTSSSLQVGMASSLLATSTIAENRCSGPQDASTLNAIERGGGLRAPAPSFLRRLTGGIAGLVLGALTLTGCEFKPGGVEPSDAGLTPDAVAFLDAADAGPAAGPSPVLPANAQILPPTWAYLFWHDGELPAGRTLAGFEVCSTPTALGDIDDDAECPNGILATQNWAVIDSLPRLSNVFWKVRARFDDASVSAWSAIQAFSTDDSLVAWWRMNGDAMDSSAAGINGALQNGVSFAAGLDGQALQSDGVDDYADMGNNAALHLNGPLTISAWVNGNGTPTSADTGILNLGSLNYALTYHTNGRVYFYIGDGGNNLNMPMSPDAWHHAAGVFDGTTNAGGMKFYLDNVLAGMRASSTATTGATGNLWIGRYDMSYFRGLVDNVTIYNRALPETALLNESCATQASGGVPLPASCQP